MERRARGVVPPVRSVLRSLALYAALGAACAPAFAHPTDILPAAVLTRASEMPGATAAIEVEPVMPIARKDCMMPHTVPKRPMNGHAEAVVARKVIERVRRDISTPIARSRAR